MDEIRIRYASPEDAPGLLKIYGIVSEYSQGGTHLSYLLAGGSTSAA